MREAHIKPPSIAVVADAMVVQGGGETVVEVLAQAFPEAPIFTLLYDPKRTPSSIEKRVVTSWLQRIPCGTRYAKALLPFYPNAIESFDLNAFDVIVSSNHTLAKGILRNAEQVHICYCHTPMRAIWERSHEELSRVPPLLRPFLRNFFLKLRVWDFTAAARVDHFIANSRITQDRIATHYRRESAVITPPIDTLRFQPDGTIGDYYLVVSRNVPYKRIDLAVAATEKLGRRLIVVGDGTDRLKSASPHVTFRGKIDPAELLELMRGARALLAPQLEDFGMAIVEMNACGRPVIAYGKGGAIETLVPGKTGVFFNEQSVPALVEAIRRFEALSFDPVLIRRHAEQFSKENFIETMRALVTRMYQAKQETRIYFEQATKLPA